MKTNSLITAILLGVFVNVYAADKIGTECPFVPTLAVAEVISAPEKGNAAISYLNKASQNEFTVSSGKDVGSIHIDGLETGTSIYIVDNSGKIYKRISFVPAAALELNLKDMGAGTFFLCYIKGEDKLIYKLELE